MEVIRSQVEEAVNYLEPKIKKPETGIILGSGLGDFEDKIEKKTIIPYESIPNFPVVTVKGHEGTLICGELGGKQILAMKGRFHYYE